MTGWIKLHRSLMTNEWEWFGDSNTTYLFMCLILLANHKDTNWRGEKIPRGCLLTGRKELSKKTGISERSIRTSLNKLKTTNKVTIKTTNRFSVISIKNYDQYQQVDQQTANKRPTSDQQVTTSKNIKNIKNEKKEIHVFIKKFNELFGGNYQPTKGRIDKLRLRLQTYSLEQILLSVDNLAASGFHQGNNDRGWKANPDFLLRSDEKVDEWLNKKPEKKATKKVFLDLEGLK